MATDNTFNTPEETFVPAIFTVADTHDLSNTASTGDTYSVLEHIGYGTADAIVSGGVQALNIVPTVGNWFGGDFEQIKTAEVLADFDSDLSRYYQQNQEGVDAVGFALGSFVPGMAGVKVLKAGQLMLRGAAETGQLGAGMAKAANLLPTKPKLLSDAIRAALEPNAGFPIWNAQTVKAMAAGAGQAALEGAAWETAVAATMYNGPVLEKQDFGDITSNILHGALAFGALGGVIGGAGTYMKIKSAGKELDAVGMPWNTIRELGENAKPSEKLINYLDELRSMPEVPTNLYTGEEAWRVGKLQGMRAEKTRYLETKIREVTGEIAGGDQAIAESLYGDFKRMGLADVEAKMFGTASVSRLGATSAAEKRLIALETKLAKDLTLEGAESEEWLHTSRVYRKLVGEGAGKVVTEKPTIYALADMLTKGEAINVTAKGVKAGDKTYKFKSDELWEVERASHREAEARQIWASKQRSFAEIEAETGKPTILNSSDLPLLEKAYLDGVLPKVRNVNPDGTIGEGYMQFYNREDFRDYLAFTKKQVVERLVKRNFKVEEAAKIANLTEERALNIKSSTTDPESGLFAWQQAKAGWEQQVKDSGRRVAGEFYDQPTWAKSVKDSTEIRDIDGNVISGMTAIKENQRLYEEASSRAAASILGDMVESFPRLPDSLLLKANRVGPGGGMFGAQNENYGTLGSMVQYLGQQTLKLIKRNQEGTRELLNVSLSKLGQNEAAAIEWSMLNQRLRSFGAVPFGYDVEAQAMKPLAQMKYERLLAEGKDVKPPMIPEGVPLEIPIKNAEAAAVVKDHLALNSKRVGELGGIRTNQGVQWNRDPERFYPIPPNTKDYPFIASVVDDSISGYGHGKMLYAATAEDLERQITQIRASDPTLKVLTKADAEGWYKSIGQYEFERTLTDRTFDASKQMSGVSASYLPATDPAKIIADTLNWHLGRDANLAREAVAHVNEAQIATLRTMGEKYANVTGSHYSKMDALSYLEMQGKNPYADYVRTMLGLSTSKDFPFWTPLNDMLDRKVSGVFNKVYEMFAVAKTPEELVAVNKHLADSGYQGAAYDAMTYAAANHTAPKGALTSFIAKANAIVSSCMIGLDPVNALNNVIGANVLRGTELKSLIRAIEAGNPEKAGELAALTRLKVPGTQNSVLSPAKLIGNAMADFHSPEGRMLREEFKKRGIISSRVEQANWVLENLALTGKETAVDLDSKIGKVWDALKGAREKGEILTGNVLAEEFNRFVSGHVVKQITDKAVEAGVLDSKAAWAYINTFVNRVEGNYIAAQRPGIFQGPVGQAIGLFQTYQFNLLQQLLRHVGEGSYKDAAVMMGLQATFYGAKGLPAFDAINTHLIGNASGNTKHRDLYNVAYGVAGKEAGDWLMYGMGSNALGILSPELKFNLYSRGDINPRNVTLLPVNPANIPFVQMTGKFFGSMAETASKIGQGGDVWGSILQGIEHAGVNRPLAGLAQVLEATNNPTQKAFSTSNKGGVVAANDWLSLTSMIRLAGAKPFDEALAIDRSFNLEAYASLDSSRRALLGEAIKTTVIAGNNPSADQVNEFAYRYTRAGGKREQFNQFMMQQYKAANTSQANKLAESLGNPFSQSMQQIMGGELLEGFSQ